MARPAKFIWLVTQWLPPPLGVFLQPFPDEGTEPLSDCNTISFGFQYFSSSSLSRILHASLRCMLITSKTTVTNTSNMFCCLMVAVVFGQSLIN